MITLYQMGTLQSVTLTESILVVEVVCGGGVVTQCIIVTVWDVLTTEMSKSGRMKVTVY